MSIWAGYFGDGDGDALKRLLGSKAQMHTGAGFGLGVYCTDGGPARLTVNEAGGVTVLVGVDEEAGASASIDLAKKTLTLTRDPFGFHGAYTAQVGEVLWYASDARVLQRLPGISNQLNPAALHGYLCFSYVPTPLTLISGVAALPAGARVIVTSKGERSCENQAAWREFPPLALDEEEAITELRKRLRAAVAQRVGAEHEVGVLLSGGIDSSFIAALLVELGVKVHLFALDFGPPFDAELPYAQQVAAHLGQSLNIVSARPPQIRSALTATAAALEQPFGDGVTVPLYLLGQAAAKHVNLIFNGEGGDQLFGGWTNKPMVAAELYAGKNYDRAAMYLNTFHRFYGFTDQFYTSYAQAAVDKVDVGGWLRPALEAKGFRSLLHRLRAANLWLKAAQNIVPRATQLAAVHGLRVRSPFFDRALAEWTFALSPKWLLHGVCEKYLLKRAAEPYLPPEAVWREKRGMGVPTTEWCLGPLRREVAHWLNPRCLKRNSWFEPKAVQALRRGKDGFGEVRRRRIGEKLWMLLMLHVWLDTQDRPPVCQRHYEGARG
jgi:asparagine synthase (glutamine-hydrolysing)